MGKLSRTKGAAFELWVARQLLKLYPDCGRKLEFQDRHANGVDLEETGSFKIQCKRLKRYATLKKIEEVEICPIEGGIPVLVTKGDHLEPIAAVYFDDFMKLIKAARKGGLT